MDGSWQPVWQTGGRESGHGRARSARESLASRAQPIEFTGLSSSTRHGTQVLRAMARGLR